MLYAYFQLEVELVPPANLPHPPPLDEALPEDIYRRHVAPPSAESRASLITTGEDLEDATEEAIETESKTGEPAVEDANDAGSQIHSNHLPPSRCHHPHLI